MNLVVVGDSLLDVDLHGSTSRLCPDAPAPVFDLRRRDYRPGGAALAAALLASDGVAVTLVTALAEDDAGNRLREALHRRGVHTVAGTRAPETPVKERLRADGQSLARIDHGGVGPWPVADERMLTALGTADAVLVSDYGRGLLRDPRLRELLGRLTERVPVVWDPHPRGARPVPETELVTPNLGEAGSVCGVDGPPERLAAELRERWRSRAAAVTLGSRGAVVDAGGRDGTAAPLLVPAGQVEATDPCGAGDRFAATAAGRLMAGETVTEAVRRAVAAATAFLAGGGAAGEWGGGMPAPIDGFARAHRVAEETRARGGTVVATGGCFDVLHAGHARTLAVARDQGDCLIVCLNSDRSVRRCKGPQRPINNEDDRAEMLRALRCVDAVAVFDEDTPEAILDELRPDVWVKGGDYRDGSPEAELVHGWGGRSVVVPYHPGRSSTRLVTAMSSDGQGAV